MAKCGVCGEKHPEGSCPFASTATGISVEQLIEGGRSVPGQKIFLREPSVPEHEAVAFLDEPSKLTRFCLPFPACKVGRSRMCDLVIAGEESVSRVHFIINFEDGTFYLSDTGSKNGTFVNGNRVADRVSLHDGDRIRAGRFCLTFSVSKTFMKKLGAHGFIKPQPVRPSVQAEPFDLDEMETLDLIMLKAQRAALESALQQARESQNDEPEESAAVENSENPTFGGEEDSFANLTDLERELMELRKQADGVQKKIREFEGRVSSAKSTSSSPVQVGTDEFIAACLKVLRMLGWTVERSDVNKQELMLSLDGKPEAIVHAIIGDAHAAIVEIGQLLDFKWSTFGDALKQAKPILILYMPPSNQDDREKVVPLPKQVDQYARTMKVSVLTSIQLFRIYRTLTSDPSLAEDIRSVVMQASGSPENL